MKKKILMIVLSILIIMECGSMFMLYNSYNDKDIITSKINIGNKNNMFSIKVQNASNSSQYDEYNSDSWPDLTKYTLNTSKTSCTDEKGTKIANLNQVLVVNNNNINVKSKTNLYCNLYFDIKKTSKTFASLIDEDDLDDSGCDGLYRYQGSSPNNYVCFGSETCSSDYVYRIIGITKDNKVKLVKNTLLNVDASWNQHGPGIPDDYYLFNETDLFKYLNDDFLNNGKHMGAGWSSLIASHNWKYGNIGCGVDWTQFSSSGAVRDYGLDCGGDYNILAPESAPVACKDEQALPNSVSAKVGLPYMSDWFYSAKFKTDLSESWFQGPSVTPVTLQRSISTAPGAGAGEGNPNQGWATSTDIYPHVFSIGKADNKSYNNSDSLSSSYTKYIIPSFYLNNNVKIIGGTGTASNPYRLYAPAACKFDPTYVNGKINLNFTYTSNGASHEIKDSSNKTVTSSSIAVNDANDTYSGYIDGNKKCSVKIFNSSTQFVLKAQLYVKSPSNPSGTKSGSESVKNIVKTLDECNKEIAKYAVSGTTCGSWTNYSDHSSQECYRCVEQTVCNSAGKVLKDSGKCINSVTY